MKFLIAGYGSIGRRHLRNLRELGENDLVLLRSHKSTLPDDEVKDVPVETDIEAALAHKPDGVIIANPTALHLDIAIPAAKAGCADYRKSYASRKDLGGGVLLTLSHPLDYLRWLFGDPEWIWGMNGKISDLELETDDIAEIGMQMTNGLIGNVHLDYYSRPARNGLEVIGSEGKLRCNNLDGIVTLRTADGKNERFSPEPAYDRNDMFLNEMRRFIAVTAGTAQPSCTLEDGIAVQRMVDLVRKSWKEKRFFSFSE